MGSLIFKNIRKVYPGGVVAVQDFNLNVDDKEFIVLVGPSGCGKSTLLKMIAGIEDITDGELYIDDILINDVQPKGRDIAMVFQNYALYPHMSVYQNMALGLELRKVPKAEIKSKIKNVAKSLQIEELMERKPKALSGGQQQRVALGHAIVRNPKVFLMDEPLSNLDAKLRAEMRIEIIKLHSELETTFIYVTHDQTEAMTMGSKIVVMKDGCIKQVATPRELYDAPANIFVAGFIGTPQMNFINVKIMYEEEETFITFGGFKIPISKKTAEILKGKNYKNSGELIMGIRPEHIGLSGENEKYNVSGIVEVIELMGSETLAHMNVGRGRITMKISSENYIKAGDKLDLIFPKEKLYLFDKETEEVI